MTPVLRDAARRRIADSTFLAPALDAALWGEHQFTRSTSRAVTARHTARQSRTMAMVTAIRFADWMTRNPKARAPQVIVQFGISRATAYRWIASYSQARAIVSGDGARP